MKTASSIRLNRRTGEVLIDGVPTGYAIADEPIHVTVDPSGATIVRIPFITREFNDLPAPALHPSEDGWLNPKE